MDHQMLGRINEELARGRPSVLAVIVSTKGSTPRKAGSLMLVFEDGSSLGTIGGGLLEAWSLKEAREVFRCKKSVLREFIMKADAAAEEGMACGGQAEVFLQYIGA